MEILARGSTVGRYLVLERIGSGAMGVVYAAYDPELDRKIALKLLHPQEDAGDELRRQSRLVREAKAIARLSHPNVVGIFDVGVHQGQVFLAMEHLGGGTLGAWLAAAPRPWRDVIRMFVEVGNGLAAAHAEGLVHRDFKPDNVLLDKQGKPKVVDFGLVRLAGAGGVAEAVAPLAGGATDAANLTRTGALTGTPAYMAPEQFLGRPLDARTDQFAFCVALHEALYGGARPYPGDTVTALADAVTAGRLADAPATASDVPGAVRRALLRGLAADPAARHPGIDALLRALVQRPAARLTRWLAAGGAALLIVAALLLGLQHRSERRRLDFERQVAAADRLLAEARSLKDPDAVRQVIDLVKARQLGDASAIIRMGATPHAAWFNSGSPRDIEHKVRKEISAAAQEARVPVLVPFNIPYRDCGQQAVTTYAADTAAYRDWIDGFARGIGDARAVVIVEPSGLGIIPYSAPLDGKPEWCRPTVTGAGGQPVPAPDATPGERFAQINHAVDSLKRQAPRAAVYLDATHSGWLSVGEAAHRLVAAGVAKADGFHVNVSSYRPTEEAIRFGTWVSACIAAVTAGAPAFAGRFDLCPGQYDAASSGGADYSDAHAARVDARFAEMLGGARATTRFVVDTSRNGRGAWQPAPGVSYPDPQPWCNPPGRGLGLPPTTATGHPLVDAFLWVKAPGESDGPCNRGIAGARTDPEWGGIVDPPAGDWFPQQALQLARLANPPLLPATGAP